MRQDARDQGSGQNSPDGTISAAARYLPVVLVLLLGSAVSWLMSERVRSADERFERQRFETAAQTRALLIRRELNQMAALVEDLGGFLQTTQRANPADFQSFVAPTLARFDAIQALEWVPRVSHAQRDTFERSQRRDIPYFQITERAQQGVMVPARARDEYFPVLLVEPLAGNETALGFDLGSDPERRRSLRQSRDSGTTLATARITLVQETGEQLGFLILRPVFLYGSQPESATDRLVNLLGFALGVFRIGEVVEHALEPLDPAGVEIRLLDGSAAGDRRFTYGDEPAGNPGMEQDAQLSAEVRDWMTTATFETAGRQWTVECTPAPGYFCTERTGSRSTLASGLVSTFLLAAFISGLLGRTKRIGRLVARRTEELARANSQLQRNVDELTEKDEALDRQTMLNERILQTTMDGYILADGEGMITNVNPSYCEVVGYRRDELIGLNIRQLEVNFDAEKVAAQIEKMFAHGGDRFETQHRRKDGSVVDLEVSATIGGIHDSPMVAAFVRDITERREAEKALRQHRENLEALVAERTAKLEAVIEELESFSYSVSHDLRAPLRHINGYSQVLLEDYEELLDADGRSYLGRIRAATENMSQLIDNLLTLSRLTRCEINRSTVNLSTLIRRTSEQLKENEPGRSITFTVADGVTVEADLHLLSIAVHNLLENACKFTSKETEARIEFGVAEDGATPVYFIRDNGVGFDIEHADSLFGAFQRLHKVEDFAGTGVGLATVRRIINRHGGRVWAEAEADKGATFYFTLA